MGRRDAAPGRGSFTATAPFAAIWNGAGDGLGQIYWLNYIASNTRTSNGTNWKSWGQPTWNLIVDLTLSWAGESKKSMLLA